MITVYSRPDCNPCVQVKKYMDRNEIPYESKDITASAEAFAEFEKFGAMGVPVISSGDQFTVGFNPMKIKSMLSGSE